MGHEALLILSAAALSMAAVLVLVSAPSGTDPRAGRRGRLGQGRFGVGRDPAGPVRSLLGQLLESRGQDQEIVREAATLLRQLAALLQSGRGPGQVWEDLAGQWSARADPAGRSLSQLCLRAAAADRAGRGAADGLSRWAAEIRRGAAAGSDRLGRQTGGSAWSALGGRRAQLRLVALLERLAGLLRLSEETGAPLSQLAEELAATLDDDGEVAAAIGSAVAGPRLTQRVLAGLPIGGLLIGQLIGADALGALWGTALGLVSLTAGVLLMILGMIWSRRMIQAVELHG